MLKVKSVNLGKNNRQSFGKITEVMEMPNLIEVQKNSYQWFLDEGLKEVLNDMSDITDYQGNLTLSFIGYELERTPKFTIAECKQRDATYAAPLTVTTQLCNSQTGEIKEERIFMGDFPLMTDSGTFVINGAERAIVSQLVRSPGVYYGKSRDKTGKELYTTTVIPNRGAWLEYETDANNVFWVRIDKNRKLPITTFIRALEEMGTDASMVEFFGESELLTTTIEKDSIKTVDEALKEIYRKLRPGEPPTPESARTHINNLFFEDRRYDLSKVGRFKFNKKLALTPRILGNKLATAVISPLTGELLYEEGAIINAEEAAVLEKNGVSVVELLVNDKKVKVISNGMVKLSDFVDVEKLKLSGKLVKEKVRFVVLKDILDNNKKDSAIKAELEKRVNELVPNHIITDDIYASISYLLNLPYGIGNDDDIDHLGNRRIRSVGELLQNQFRIGFARMERVIRERMATSAQEQTETASAQSLINIRPVVAAIREFFGSSPLSQFMDQNNPLAELTHKRRLSALGPGGLSRDRAGFEVRDVHYTHYGRMCPIETPEGPNIGLISYLATFARINEYGFIEAPYRRVVKGEGKVLDEVVYMTADIEDQYIVAQANEPIDENGYFANAKVAARFRDTILEIEREKVDFIDISPKMVVSVATAMIPFLENDDANRALMGSNMQRQAVPLLTTENPIVATGMEYKAAVDSGVVVLAKENGTVSYVSADKIVIKDSKGIEHEYRLIKFMRSNQGTCINQRPNVEVGEKVKVGDVLADGPATHQGEISLGKNMLIGFMEWEGYNYEDAVLINERLVKDDIYTSVHIEKYETEARDTKLGPEEITNDIPNVGEDMLKELDERGIVRVGAEVRAGDILVGKVTPKGETDLNAEERLLRAIFGAKAREVRDTSLRVPHGEYGIVVNVDVFTRENSDELSPGVNQVVRVYIAQKRKISVGDKMAGRHGNKGVVSRVLPQEDMPYLPGGRTLDILLNPLGVPSRMNIGQVLEVHLGRAAQELGIKVMTPVFDGAKESDIRQALTDAGLAEDGKTILYDGRTGQPFDNRVTVGVMYYLKLHHLVDDKIHARSTGPYSLVTQQPLGGKAQFGGQRFGEMEVWALEAYGAAYTLQEILTIKSDDVIGRVKTFEAIVKGNNVPKPGIPEAFKVMIKELQSLALDVRVLDTEGNEVDLKNNFDDDDNYAPAPSYAEEMNSEPLSADDQEFNEAGFGFESEEEKSLSEADFSREATDDDFNK